MPADRWNMRQGREVLRRKREYGLSTPAYRLPCHCALFGRRGWTYSSRTASARKVKALRGEDIVARKGTPKGDGQRTGSYTHPTATALMRPEIGTQAQFRKKKPSAHYRYESSLALALDWDGQNSAREQRGADRDPTCTHSRFTGTLVRDAM